LKLKSGLSYHVNIALALSVIPLLTVLLWPEKARALETRTSGTAGITEEEALKRGERIYREGILPSGKPLTAFVQGDIPVSGKTFACVSCHLRSGMGSFEGGVVTPPTNGATLFRPPKMFYKGLEVKSLPTRRPAYTDASLAAALRFGIDPSGRIMSEIMPRYQMQDKDMELLIFYLKVLSANFSPGLSDSTFHLATVVAEDVEAEYRNAMLGPLEDYVRRRNNAAARRASYPPPGSSEATDVSSMRLSLSVWLLKGPPGTWRSQLEEYHRKEPVFALVGGMTKKEWRPIHMFSEENRIPCILPVADFPVISETDWYTLYFSKGFYQEGEGAALYLNTIEEALKDKAIVQIVRESPEGRALSAGFEETWEGMGHGKPVTVALPQGEALTGGLLQKVADRENPFALIIWDNSEAAPAIGSMLDWKNRPGMIIVSSGYLGKGMWALKDEVRDFTYITYPFRLPESEERYTGIVKSSLGIDKDPGDTTAISKKAYSIIRVLNDALLGINGQYYRDNLLDAIDMGRGSAGMGTVVQDETYPLYERFSFGPGQRYSSKGCYIVTLSKGPKPQLIKKSDWVIH